MASVTIDFNQRGFLNAVRQSALGTIKAYVQALKRTIIGLFRLPKTGRVYRYRGRRYRAAAAGEPPGIRSARLLNSVRDSFPDPLTGILSIDAPYAGHVNKRHPFVRPALKSVSQRFGGGARARFN